MAPDALGATKTFAFPEGSGVGVGVVPGDVGFVPVEVGGEPGDAGVAAVEELLFEFTGRKF